MEPSPQPEFGPIESNATVLRRIRIFALIGYVVFAVWMLISGGLWALIGLTCSTVVVMINFLWLEGIVVKVLQPTPHVSAWRLAFRTMARFALFGVALAVTIVVARFDAISVLLGFSIVVVGIMGEALYSGLREAARDRATRSGGGESDGTP
jgi:hypothetical protein